MVSALILKGLKVGKAISARVMGTKSKSIINMKQCEVRAVSGIRPQLTCDDALCLLPSGTKPPTTISPK